MPKKPTKRIKQMNILSDEERLIINIRREIDRLPDVSKERKTTNRKFDLIGTCIVINVIFSILAGSILIMTGALYSDFIIFTCGIFIFLEGILAYTSFGVLPFVIRNLKLMKIHRNILRK